MPPRRLLPLAVLALAAALPAPALAADLLPDLDQETPDGLTVTTDLSGATPRYHLGFDSAVDNRGAGPLIISGHRASEAAQQMTADQTIRQSDGGTRTIAGIGRLEYVHSEDHDHWHYLGFDRYELRRAADYKLIAPDQKTGFCLGDRYNTDPQSRVGAEPDQAFYTGYCGRGQTQLLSVVEGISVGYGDVYFATLEGQFVDLTGVAAGEYYLVHRVNADRKLRESNYRNNASSLRIAIAWPGGRATSPSVKVLHGCKDGDYCPGPHQQPPALTRAAAERYAVAGLRRVLGFEPRGFTVLCARARSRVSRSCSATGVHAGRRYALRETVSYERWKRGLLFYRYSVSGTVAARKLPPGSGRVRIGKARASAAVAQPSQRLVAFDHPPLDGVGFSTVVH
jgi:hypothetical protein